MILRTVRAERGGAWFAVGSDRAGAPLSRTAQVSRTRTAIGVVLPAR